MQRTKAARELLSVAEDARRSGRFASAILTSDFHLTETAPVSRLDDYIAAQGAALQFLQKLSSENWNCPILCAGDVFHHWKASPWWCAWVYHHLPHPFVTIPGNHDLPLHSFAHYGRSALALMEAVSDPRKLRVLKWEETVVNDLPILGIPFGQLGNTDPRSTYLGARRRVLMLHELVWARRGEMEARIGGGTAEELLEQFGDVFDLIVTGDNHEGFVVRSEQTGAILVNPGSMMQMTADQEHYVPQCFLYYAEENKVAAVNFPVAEGVHSRAHIDRVNERDARVAAYIANMRAGWDVGLSFRENLQAYFQENRTPRRLRELVWEHLGDEP